MKDLHGMEQIKKELLEDAMQHALEHHNTSAILPVGDKTWEECYTHDMDMIILWYDVELPHLGRTTGIVTRDILN